MNYTIYSDGAYSQKNNEGAFAFVILDGDSEREVKRMAGKIKDETNNRAELKAIIAAVHSLPHDATHVRIISDSMYALNTLSGKWRRNTNKDLFEVWEQRVMRFMEDVKFEWCFVKGHSGDYYNELCDRICTETLGYDPKVEYERFIKK